MSSWLIVFCYILVAYGACNVIVFGEGPFHIFERLRDWANGISEHFGKLFSCMMCLPANFGWICSLFNWFLISVPFTPFNLILGQENGLWWLAALCDGAFTTGVVWLIHSVQEWFENNSGQQVLESDDEMMQDE